MDETTKQTYLEGSIYGQGKEFFIDIYSLLNVTPIPAGVEYDPAVIKIAFLSKLKIYNLDTGLVALSRIPANAAGRRIYLESLPIELQHLARIQEDIGISGIIPVIRLVMQSAVWARNVLLDPDKRRQYDDAFAMWDGIYSGLDIESPLISYAFETITDAQEIPIYPDFSANRISQRLEELNSTEEYQDVDVNITMQIVNEALIVADLMDTNLRMQVLANLEILDARLMHEEYIIREELGIVKDSADDPPYEYIAALREEIARAREALKNDIEIKNINTDLWLTPLLDRPRLPTRNKYLRRNLRKNYSKRSKLKHRNNYEKRMFEFFDNSIAMLMSIAMIREEVMRSRLILDIPETLNEGSLDNPEEVIIMSYLPDMPRLLILIIDDEGKPIKLVENKPIEPDDYETTMEAIKEYCAESNFWLLSIEHKAGLGIQEHLEAALRWHMKRVKRLKQNS